MTRLKPSLQSHGRAPLSQYGAVYGEHHPSAKLTAMKAEDIRQRHEAGRDGTGPKVTYKQLAAEHQVTKATIADICTYRTWRTEFPHAFKTLDK